MNRMRNDVRPPLSDFFLAPESVGMILDDGIGKKNMPLAMRSAAGF